MKLHEFFIQQLDEVSQAPTRLVQFANSPEAEGIIAGFEAELCFSDILDNNTSDESEPDMEYDNRTYSIDNIITFFRQGDNMGYRELDRLQTSLTEDFLEWVTEQASEDFERNKERLIKDYIIENEWDWDEQIKIDLKDNGYDDGRIEDAIFANNKIIKLRNNFQKDSEEYKSEVKPYLDDYELYLIGKDLADKTLNDMVENSISSRDDIYDQTEEHIREEYGEDPNMENEWLADADLSYMSDVNLAYDDAYWPFWTSGSDDDEGFSESAAEWLANDLKAKLGVRTFVSSGHGSGGDREKDWVFEPDGSLRANSTGDMTVEIVSPPMPLKDCLAIMPKFFKWAEHRDAYANESTGFHMSVSVPSQDTSLIDYTKLALFLGDVHVLEEFDRDGNHFCVSAMEKIKSRVAKGNIDIENVFTLMKEGLDKIASGLIAPNGGFGKYISINPKDKYIEFRSAGNTDYFDDMDKLQNTLRRYAQAIHIASDPSYERKEYQKKLYKLLAPTEKIAPELAKKLASFSAGRLSKEELDNWLKDLKSTLFKKNLIRNTDSLAASGKILNWDVSAKGDPKYNYCNVFAKTKKDAIELVKKWETEWHNTNASADEWEATLVGESTIEASMKRVAVRDVSGNLTIANNSANLSNVSLTQSKWELVNNNELEPKRVRRVLASDKSVAEVIADSWLRSMYNQRNGLAGFELKPLNEVARSEMNQSAQTRSSSNVQDIGMDIAQNFIPGSTLDLQRQRQQAGQQSGGEFTGEWVVLNGSDQEVYRFSGIGNSQSDANRVAGEWAQRTGYFDHGNNFRFSVYPVMGSNTNQPSERQSDNVSTQVTVWKVRLISTGEILHEFRLIPGPNRQAAANEYAEDWAGRHGYGDPVDAILARF